jgi:diacylglycerol kinase family enzyme
MSAPSAGVTCILNARAGDDAHELPRRVGQLFAAGGCPARILVATNEDELQAYVKQAADWDTPLVAGGGDGTVNTIASGLVGTDRVLGVLPLGTLNHFAKNLGLPLDLPGAVQTVITGRVTAVDVGEVNGQLFLNNSSIGTYSRLVLGRNAEQRRGHSKKIALTMAAVAALWRRSSLQVRVRVDGVEEQERKTPLLFIGNNRYTMQGLEIGGRTRLDSGRLWICLVPLEGAGSLLQLAMRVIVGQLRPDDLEVQDAKEIWIKTRRDWVDVAWDGEVTRMASPLHYRIRPMALRVMTPSSPVPSRE